MDAKEIVQEYEQTYGERLEEALVEELLKKYNDVERVRMALGLGLKGSYKRLSELRKGLEGFFTRAKVLKKLTEKEIKGRILKVYLIGDDSGYAILSNWTNRELEEGKTYAIGPLKVSGFVRFAFFYLPEVHMYQNSKAFEIDYPDYALPEVTEVDLKELSNIMGKPVVFAVEGVVKRKFDRGLVLSTDFGELYLSLSPVHKGLKLIEGDRIRVHGLGFSIEISAAARIERIGAEKVEKLRGIILKAAKRVSKKKHEYSFYVLYDPKTDTVSRLFGFDRPLEASEGDYVEIEYSKLGESRYKILAMHVIARGVPKKIRAKVLRSKSVSLPMDEEVCIAELDNGMKLVSVVEKGRCYAEGDEIEVFARAIDGVLIGGPECYEALVLDFKDGKLIVHIGDELKEIEPVGLEDPTKVINEYVEVCFEGGKVKSIRPEKERTLFSLHYLFRSYGGEGRSDNSFRSEAFWKDEARSGF